LIITLSDDDKPCIRDRRGRRYLPVHLGGCYHDYLPTLVKFLCTFGPGELSAVFTPPLIRRVNGMAVQERSVIGNVVLHRKTWRVPVTELREALDHSSNSERYARLQAWRRRRGIPERVFAAERVPHPLLGFRYQPQYIDFTSPLFIAILQALASAPAAIVDFAEMLPDAGVFPRDANGQAWAIELLVDSRFAGNRGERCFSQTGVAGVAGS
jgi:hypothetical protein